MNNKRIIIIVVIGLIIIAGILLAVLISPVTNMLLNGTGDDFRNAGSCAAKQHTESTTPAPTQFEGDDIIVVIGANDTPVPVTTQPVNNTDMPESTR